MKTEVRIGLIVAVLLGTAAQGFGQGSMSRYATSARNTLGPGKSSSSPSTNGFTIGAQRHLDQKVAITVSSATRFWFLDPIGTSDAVVAEGRYGNTSLWAQRSPAGPVLAIGGNDRSLNASSRQFSLRNLEYNAGQAIPQFDPDSTLYGEGQAAAWMQSNIRFVKVDPVP